MKQPIFAMERWQSHHENRVDFNLAESGVQPITLDELRSIATVDPSDTLLGYGHTDGSPLLRERIAAMYPGAAADNVVATVGSAEANFLAMWRLVEPGDRVVVVRPAYEQTTGLAAGLGAHVESVWLQENLGWQPAPGAAAEAIQPGTRVVVVTNPNNPTAQPLGEAATAEIVEAAERAGAWILSDEVYAGGELSGEPTPSMWGRTDRVLVSASLSKAYGLPGLRLGWLLAPPEFREELWARKDYTTIAPSPLSDRLGAAALEPAVRGRAAGARAPHPAREPRRPGGLGRRTRRHPELREAPRRGRGVLRLRSADRFDPAGRAAARGTEHARGARGPVRTRSPLPHRVRIHEPAPRAGPGARVPPDRRARAGTGPMSAGAAAC